jgi:hypothetical protein
VDAAPDAGYFGKPLEFGEAYCELSAHGWVTSLAWSPSGNTLCFAGEIFLPAITNFVWQP